MKSKLISKILGVGVSAGMVVALSGALIAAPVAADTTEWSTINTPSETDGVILPASDILDYAVSGEDGNTIYVIAEVQRACAEVNPFLDEIWVTEPVPEDPETEGDQSVPGVPFQYGLFKSTDGGITWSDITQNVLDSDNLEDFDPFAEEGTAADIFSLNYVAVAPDDEDWVAVTGYGNQINDEDAVINTFPPFTVASKDGGDNFVWTTEMEDSDEGSSLDIVFDTEVSPETADGLHLIAAMGAALFDTTANPLLPTGVDMVQPLFTTPPIILQPGQGTVYILNAGTWLTGGWEDTSFWDGWDGGEEGNAEFDTEEIHSLAEIDGAFSPNFEEDCALVIIGDADDLEDIVAPISPYVQTLDTCAEQWGEEASLPGPIEIDADGHDLMTEPGIWQEGIALPADYDAEDSGARVVFGYVDAFDFVDLQLGGFVFRIDNTDVSPQVAPSDNPILASIAVSGDADTGKMMIGEYVQMENDDIPVIDVAPAEPCAGVRVWHTAELDICCPKWELCCKCPSGTYAARVAYTPDGSKEYATTTSSDAFHDLMGLNAPVVDDFDEDDINDPVGDPWGNPGDETAFSVSLDDANSWNQLGLIDTDIDKLSDLVICPDCSVMYLSTINDGLPPFFECDEEDCDADLAWFFACDSVWRSFDNGETWERVNHGDWTDLLTSFDSIGIYPDDPMPDVDGDLDDIEDGDLLLRLPCEDTENCCDYTDPSAPGGTVYLGVQGTDNLFYSRDCGQCWTQTPDTKIDIQDVAVDTESTVYVLDIDGNVSKSTNFGRRWSDSTDTGIDSGHMITVCCPQGLVLVGGFGGDPVAWSDDGGDSWNTTDDVPVDGEVHVACATTCENIIYIAVDGEDGAVYRGDLTDGSWSELNTVDDVDYTGIAVGKSDGTLYASIDYLGVVDDWYDLSDNEEHTPCDRYFDASPDSASAYYVSAVARNLDPCETACCGTEDWDYLICGLNDIGECNVGEDFDAQVNALDICGCLTAATNTKLYAIDSEEYDIRDGSNGTIWTYEDCASKVGPTLVAPVNEAVLNCMACEGCGAQPFTLKWNRMCNACSYDVEIMDEDGNVVVSLDDIVVTGTTCTFYFNPGSAIDKENFFEELVCGSSYQWHVREANTDCECIHSRWSDTWTFTVASSSVNGVKLIAPTMAANDVGTTNIGFSWTSVPDATSYSFVLSPNANLASALVSQEISTTAFNFAGPLENLKTYYWQVKAWKGTTLLSTSSVGVFTIAPAPVAPPPPTVVEQTPPPQINIPPAQQVTPTWIYIAVGIAVALVVVVVVLVTRTRRR